GVGEFQLLAPDGAVTPTVSYEDKWPSLSRIAVRSLLDNQWLARIPGIASRFIIGQPESHLGRTCPGSEGSILAGSILPWATLSCRRSASGAWAVEGSDL